MFDEESLSKLDPSVNLQIQQIVKQALRPSPSRARFEDYNIAKAFHENVSIKNYSCKNNLIYPTKRYLDGSYGFLFPEPCHAQTRVDLLEKYFLTQYLDKSGNKTSPLLLKENIKVSRFIFMPYQPFFYTDPKTGMDYVNLWSPPYWWQVSQGLVAQPKRNVRKGELELFQRKLFCHLFRDNLVKMWIKGTLTGRNKTALMLMADSRTGKTALMQMVASLHAPNAHTAYTLSSFAGKQFSIGTLKNKTFTGLNEGCVKPEYFEIIKTFVNNPTFEAEIKNVQSESHTNHNNLMICSDKFDAAKGSDQALLNRLIIPHMSNRVLEAGTPVVMEDGTTSFFTQEEIIRIYNMSTQDNAPQALSDSLALAEHLMQFEDSSIDLTSRDVTGYQNKEAASNNFVETLKPWQTAFLRHFFLPHAKLCPINNGKHVITQDKIKLLIAHANKSPEIRDLVKEAAINGYDQITENKIKELATQNAGVMTLIYGKASTYRIEIHKDTLDAFFQESNTVNVEATVAPEPIPEPIPEPYVAPNSGVQVTCWDFTPEPEPKHITKKPIVGKFAFLDFEFHLHCKYPKLMACVVNSDNNVTKEWLWHTQDYTGLKSQILRLKEENYFFVSFTDAEPRCFYQLGLNPLNFKWIDSQILGYPFYHSSKEFSKYANISTLPDKPYFEEDMDEEDVIEHNDKSSRKKTASLIGFHNFFCNSTTDKEAEIKEATRKLILSIKPNDNVGQLEKEQILHYCAQDVNMLEELFYAQINKWVEITGKDSDVIIERFHNFTMHRVRMCDVSYHGLPINKQVYDNLCVTYEERVKQEQSKMGDFYRYEGPELYKVNCKTGRKGDIKIPPKYVEDNNLLYNYIKNNNLTKVWPKTKSGKYSADQETLQKFSAYPEVMNYFMGKKRVKHIEFFKPDSVTGKPKISKFITEEDGVLLQHPEYGALATITGRHAHKTSTFIMGMERSLRKELLGCPEGYTILQPDFSAQEVWIGGALSGDQNMLRASFECPYIRSGQNAGVIPAGANKHTHAADREVFKRVVLAPLYGMGDEALSIQIRKDIETTKRFSRENRKFYKVFFDWQEEFIRSHESTHYAELLNGWVLLDNYNAFGKYKKTTAKNWKIQGHGAVIMMKVVELFYTNKPENVKLIYTLHDEFGIQCPTENIEIVSNFMREIMQEACRFYFPNVNPPKIGFK